MVAFVRLGAICRMAIGMGKNLGESYHVAGRGDFFWTGNLQDRPI